MLILRDATYKEILGFLDACDKYGKNISSVISHLPDEITANAAGGSGNGGPLMMMEPSTVSHEARKLKAVFLKLREW
jgi:hypothetical protein